MTWRKAWIGLGGNIGNVSDAMNKAISALDNHTGIRLRAVSSLYATQPWGVADQPEYNNACIEILTDMKPQALLSACLETEAGLKRVRKNRWGPRTIDLDILAMERVEVDVDGLTIPHSRLRERAFALAPMAELAPEFVVDGKPVSRWLETLDLNGIRVISKPAEWFGNQT
jgi:2-amino-4-hydroxy-6-hydroxymethyldihydropteridine diphosphokinase